MTLFTFVSRFVFYIVVFLSVVYAFVSFSALFFVFPSISICSTTIFSLVPYIALSLAFALARFVYSTFYSTFNPTRTGTGTGTVNSIHVSAAQTTTCTTTGAAAESEIAKSIITESATAEPVTAEPTVAEPIDATPAVAAKLVTTKSIAINTEASWPFSSPSIAQQLQDEVAAHQATRSQVAGLVAQVNGHVETESELRSDARALRAQYERRRIELQGAVDELQRVKNELAAATGANRDQMLVIDDLRAQVEIKSNKSMDACDKCADAEALLAAVSKEKDDHSRMIAQLRTQVAEKTAKIELETEKRAEAEAVVAEWEANVDAAAAMMREFTRKMVKKTRRALRREQKIRSEFEQFKAKAAGYVARVTRVEEQLVAKTHEAACLKCKVEGMFDLLSAAKKDAGELRREALAFKMLAAANAEYTRTIPTAVEDELCAAVARIPVSRRPVPVKADKTGDSGGCGSASSSSSPSSAASSSACTSPTLAASAEPAATTNADMVAVLLSLVSTPSAASTASSSSSSSPLASAELAQPQHVAGTSEPTPASSSSAPATWAAPSAEAVALAQVNMPADDVLLAGVDGIEHMDEYARAATLGWMQAMWVHEQVGTFAAAPVATGAAEQGVDSSMPMSAGESAHAVIPAGPSGGAHAVESSVSAAVGGVRQQVPVGERKKHVRKPVVR